MRTNARLTLATWLVLLVGGALVPLLVFTAFTVSRLASTYREREEQAQADTTRALALAVDAELQAWKAALLALAESNEVSAANWAASHAEASRVAARYGGWVTLTDARGQQLFHTLRPYGTPLATSPNRIRAVFTDRKPTITDLFVGTVSQRLAVSVVVPVWREGRVAYVMDMAVSPERLSRLLEEQELPPSWVAGINDRQQRLVARSKDATLQLGQSALDWRPPGAGAAESGMFTAVLGDGRETRTAFRRLSEVPWILVLAVPTAELQATGPPWRFVVVGVGLGLVAVGMAVYLGRRIAAPVTALADRSEALLRGEVSRLPVSPGSREVERLHAALTEAARSVHASSLARERAAHAEAVATAAAASEQRLRATLAEKEAALADNATLLREVHHRTKNNLQMLCDLLYLQMEGLPDREQHRDLQDAYGRIYAIARLHEQLYESMQEGQVQLAGYLGRLISGFESLYATVPIALDAPDADLALGMDRAIHVGLIINELVTNALKHAFVGRHDGRIDVRLRTAGDQLELQVRDNGIGLPANLDPTKAKSLGLRIVQILAKRLNARVAVQTTHGTTVTVVFPLRGDEPVEPRLE